MQYTLLYSKSIHTESICTVDSYIRVMQTISLLTQLTYSYNWLIHTIHPFLRPSYSYSHVSKETEDGEEAGSGGVQLPDVTFVNEPLRMLPLQCSPDTTPSPGCRWCLRRHEGRGEQPSRRRLFPIIMWSVPPLRLRRGLEFRCMYAHTYSHT